MSEIARDKRQADGGAVRLFLLDSSTGEPVAGAVVSLFADSQRSRSQLVASLQTDHSGYASFKLSAATISASSQFRVSHAGARGDALVLTAGDLSAAGGAHVVSVDASSLDVLGPSPGLPAVMVPDAQDLAVSPGSIGLIPHLMRGRGLCGQLMPTTMAVRRFEAFRVVADICEPEVLSCGERVQIVRGKVLEYEVAWHPAGTALGDLLNTITLAPCEQVNLAVVDWTRRETAALDQASDVRQHASQQMDHDRLVTEAMHSSVQNKSFTFASGTTSGATAAIPIEAVKLDMTAAWGAGFVKSTSSQSVAADTTSRLAERIVQASSFVASQRNSTVVQTTASEQQAYQTRTVRNHNHCHTLNLMYYQVNRNYRVVTDYRGERDVILVRYDNKDFDARRAYCNAEMLKDALIDPDLRGSFKELGDALFCCDRKPVGNDVLMDSFTIAVTLLPGPGQITDIQPVLQTTNGPMLLPWTHVGWHGGGVYTQTFTLPGQLDPKQVTSLMVFKQMTGSGSMSGFFPVVVSDVEVTYHASGYSAPLALASTHTQRTWEPVLVLETKAELPPVTEGETPCVDSSCGIKKLLAHLNCHKRYYNALLWLGENPNDRVMRWGCCVAAGETLSLIGQIENEPLTVFGDFVVFPVAGSPLVDDPSIAPVSKLVTLPTPGVFAEGILGHCDTCEIIDPDRRWDWKDSPCPDSAPPVGAAPAPQPGVKLSDLKLDSITPLLSFVGVPTAPESGLREMITTLLASADGGSASAQALLEKLMETIKDSIPKSSGLPAAPEA